METALTAKAKQAFAVYKNGIGRQIIDGLIAEVERLTDFSVAVHSALPPRPPAGHDFIDAAKIKYFDAVQSVVYPRKE